MINFKKLLILTLTVFCLSPVKAQDQRILVIASSQKQVTLRDGSKLESGFFLNELSVPALMLNKAGYEIVLATPQGNLPSMDIRSINRRFFGDSEEKLKEAKLFVKGLSTISLTEALKQINTFKGIFIPGGYAPLEDLIADDNLGKILHYAHEHQLPTALICHGQAGLLSALEHSLEFQQALRSQNDKKAMQLADNFIYQGYHITAFSDAEEYPSELRYQSFMPFHLEDALLYAGLQLELAPPGSAHVVVDRELVTGQNPASDKSLGSALLELLQKN